MQEWEIKQEHHDATQLVWEGPAHKGRVWNDECRTALAETGHTAMDLYSCKCWLERGRDDRA
jgi:hypothetical protein